MNSELTGYSENHRDFASKFVEFCVQEHRIFQRRSVRPLACEKGAPMVGRGVRG
jgi:hypothetical protein